MAKLLEASLILDVLFILLLPVSAQGFVTASANGDLAPLALAVAIIFLIAAITAYLTLRIEFLSIRLIIAGIAVVMIGTVLLLFGNYNGGFTYAMLGAGCSLLGVILLLVGDWKAGAFNKRIAKWLEDVSANK